MVMIRSPSVQSLIKELKIPLGSAQLIKQAANHGKPTTALKYANELMEGFGVENLYPDYPNFYYVNMGDTYDKTLYYNGTSIMIGSWGDYVERHPRSIGNFGGKPSKAGEKVRFVKDAVKQNARGFKEFLWDNMKTAPVELGYCGCKSAKKKVRK